jgi:hypothetical protein
MMPPANGTGLDAAEPSVRPARYPSAEPVKKLQPARTALPDEVFATALN